MSAATRVKLDMTDNTVVLTDEYLREVRSSLVQKGADPDSPLFLTKTRHQVGYYSGYATKVSFVMNKPVTEAERKKKQDAAMKKILAEATAAGLKVTVK